jgi:hypothetical protein
MITGLTLSSAGSPHFFRERGDRAEHPAAAERRSRGVMSASCDARARRLAANVELPVHGVFGIDPRIRQGATMAWLTGKV